MFKKIFYSFIISISIFSCKSIDNNNIDHSIVKEKKSLILSVPFFGSLNQDLKFTDSNSAHMALVNQVFETLLYVNPKTNKIEPLLVSEFKCDSAYRTFSFTLKQNIYFHDHECFKNGKGRVLEASDVIHCFNLLNETWIKQQKDATTDSLKDSTIHLAVDTTILNIDTLQEKVIPLIESILLTSKFKFTITLYKRDSDFLSKLCKTPFYIYPKELHSNTQNSWVGTGPFLYAKKSQKSVYVIKNPHYHLSNAPKLDGIRFVECSQQEAGKQFSRGGIDVLFKHPIKNYKIKVQSDVLNLEKNNLLNWDFRSTFIIQAQQIEPIN